MGEHKHSTRPSVAHCTTHERPADKEKEKVNMGKKMAAEFWGTFFLVCFVGFIFARGNGEGGPLAVGMLLMLLIYCFGTVSGAHLNPAVSVGLMIAGKCPPSIGIPYIISQFFGAGLGCAVWANLMDAPMQLGVNMKKDEAHKHNLVPGTKEEINDGMIFWLEMIYTSFLVFTVLCCACSHHSQGKAYFGIAIGSCLTASATAIGGLTGCAINPAVALSVALSYSGHDHWWHLLTYWAAHLCGAILGAIMYKLTHPYEYGGKEGHFEKILGEFWGTFLLGLTIGLNTLMGAGQVQTALGIGACLCALVYSLGHVSGAHLNPAVTLAVAAARRGKLQAAQFGGYFIMQILGAWFGLWLATSPWGFDAKTGGRTYNVYRPLGCGQPFRSTNDLETANGCPGSTNTDIDEIHYAEVFFAETIFTCILCSVVLHLTTVTTGRLDVGRDIFGFAIGMCVTVAVIGGWYFGISMNPAITLGQDIVMAIGGYDDSSTAAFPGRPVQRLPFGYSLLLMLGSFLGACFAMCILQATRPEEFNSAYIEDDVANDPEGPEQMHCYDDDCCVKGDDADQKASEKQEETAPAGVVVEVDAEAKA